MTTSSSCRSHFAIALTALFASSLTGIAEMNLSISSNFPGGNINVESIKGSTAHIAPDQRDNKLNWFYWYFSTEASQVGRADFIFQGANISVRGPAFSLDDGKTWKWLGKEHVSYSIPKEKAEESFYFDFTQPGQKVRFSVGFPYVQSNFDEFLQKNAGNPNITKSILTKSTKGRPVELLQVGKPGPGVTSVLVGARSHACEALASYVLEGLISEAMSDSLAGVEFRKKYVLYAIPFIDKDGVEEGDQGKNRAPHDHNRDYGQSNMFPEVKALQDLAQEKQVRVAIDFHCPYLRGDVHEAYHWLGLKVPHIADNMAELNSWLAEERPLANNTAISFLKTPDESSAKTENIPFSWYFAQQENNLIGVTLESPYAQAEDVDSARNYGQGLLRALVRTELIDSEPGSTRGHGNFAAFAEYRQQMSFILGQPGKAIEATKQYLTPEAPAIYRAQANLSMATVNQRQRKFDEAIEYVKAVIAEPGATANQKITARVQAITILSRNPAASPETLDAAIAELEAQSFAAPNNFGAAYKDAVRFYSEQNDLPKALAFAEKRAAVALNWEKGGAILNVASILDSMDKKQEAIERRKEAADLLKPQVTIPPTGKGILLGAMMVDYFDALDGIPTSTKEEKVEAANIVINYPTLPAGEKDRIQKWLDENK